MTTIRLDIRQLAENNGGNPIAPVTVPEAIIFEDGSSFGDLIGNTDISNMGDGSLKGAINSLNSGLVLQFTANGWSSTETVNNITYYTQSVNVTHVSVTNPIINIAALSGTLPTNAEKKAYDKVNYFTVNDTTNIVKGYAVTAPTDTFAILVKGVS